MSHCTILQEEENCAIPKIKMSNHGEIRYEEVIKTPTKDVLILQQDIVNFTALMMLEN